MFVTCMKICETEPHVNRSWGAPLPWHSTVCGGKWCQTLPSTWWWCSQKMYTL